MANKIILPGAWELIEDVPYKLFVLKVPPAWLRAAKHLAIQRVQRIGGYASVPVSSLDPIISASFPQIIKTVRKGWQQPGIPWLFATEKVDLTCLPELIRDWLRQEFSWLLGEENVNAILNNLNNSDWIWEEKGIKLSLLEQPKENHSEFRFQTIPDYIAKRFLENNTVKFQGENTEHQLEFYPVIRLNQGTELMSWPPYRISGSKKTEFAYVSFVIYFSLQTVPRRKQPLIYHYLSLRTWISEPLEKGLPYKGATGFVGDNRRWLDGSRQPYSFIHLRMKEASRRVYWHRAISELLILNDSPLPDAEDVASQPQYNWSNSNEQPQGIQIAIAYDSRHIIDKPSLPGVSSRDLASLDAAIIDKINEGLPLKRVGEAVEVSNTYFPYWGKVNPKKKDDKTPKKADDSTNPMHRPALAAPAVFNKKENSLRTILIVWEHQRCRDELVQEICSRLYLTSPTEIQTYNTPGGVEVQESVYTAIYGSICIKTIHVGELTRNFEFNCPPRERQQRRVELLEERIQRIESYLPQTQELSGAIIEIKRKPIIPETDPKKALRIGAARANYLNQHITSITGRKKDTQEEFVFRDGLSRVKSAVSDLFRQFAILPTPLINPEKDNIALHTWLTCFYVLRRTRQTTVSDKPSTVVLILRVNPVNGIVEVTTPNWFEDENKGWVPYPIAEQLFLDEKWEPDSDFEESSQESDNEEADKKKKQEQRQVDNFVSRCLQDCLNTPIGEEKNPQVLFMAEAQNARRLLTWLQNPYVPLSSGEFPSQLERDYQFTLSEKQRISIVRLRESKQNEVPVTIVAKSPGNKVSGVFKWNNVCDNFQENIYLSIRKPLNTEQGLLRNSQSRLDDGNKPIGNPKPLEIVVIYNRGIEQNTFVKFIHNLRDRYPYFSNFNTLPFPFPLAIKTKEYAIGVRDRVESQELESEEESQDEY